MAAHSSPALAGLSRLAGVVLAEKTAGRALRPGRLETVRQRWVAEG